MVGPTGSMSIAVEEAEPRASSSHREAASLSEAQPTQTQTDVITQLLPTLYFLSANSSTAYY